MTVSLVLRIVAVWVTVSVPVSLAVAAFIHAGHGEDGAR